MEQIQSSIDDLVHYSEETLKRAKKSLQDIAMAHRYEEVIKLCAEQDAVMGTGDQNLNMVLGILKADYEAGKQLTEVEVSTALLNKNYGGSRKGDRVAPNRAARRAAKRRKK